MRFIEARIPLPIPDALGIPAFVLPLYQNEKVAERMQKRLSPNAAALIAKLWGIEAESCPTGRPPAAIRGESEVLFRDDTFCQISRTTLPRWYGPQISARGTRGEVDVRKQKRPRKV